MPVRADTHFIAVTCNYYARHIKPVATELYLRLPPNYSGVVPLKLNILSAEYHTFRTTINLQIRVNMKGRALRDKGLLPFVFKTYPQRFAP